MPQFDISTYFGQVFWFLVSFLFLYAFVKLVFVPRLNALLNSRICLLNGNRKLLAEIKADVQRFEDIRAAAVSDARFAAENILRDAGISVAKLEKDMSERLLIFKNELSEENEVLISAFFENESSAFRELFVQLVEDCYSIIYASFLPDRDGARVDSLRKIAIRDFVFLFEKIRQCR